MNAPAQTRRTFGNGGGPSARDLLDQGERLGQDVAALAAGVRQAASGWEALLRQRLERHPYSTLAAAMSVGYVLGGGVPTLLLRSLIGWGGRLAVEQAIARLALSARPEPSAPRGF